MGEIPGTYVGPAEPYAPEKSPTFFDQALAGLRSENEIGSTLSRRPLPSEVMPPEELARGTTSPGDEGLVPPPSPYFREGDTVWNYLTEDEKTSPAFDRFVKARSIRDLETVRAQVEDERRNREIMAKGPLPEWLIGLMAGIVSPTTYIPIGGPLYRGARVGQSVLRLGAEATGGALLQEGILQATQTTRTMEESVASVLLAATLGIGLGAGVGALNARAAARSTAAFSDALRQNVTEDLTALARATGHGDVPFSPAPFLGSTAVGRFMNAVDHRPIITGLPSSRAIELPEAEILAALREAAPAKFERVTKAADEVAALQKEIAIFEAKQEAADLLKSPSVRVFGEVDDAFKTRLANAVIQAADESKGPLARAAARAQAETLKQSMELAPAYSRLLDKLEEAIAKQDAAEADVAKLAVDARREMEYASEFVSGPRLEGNIAAKAVTEFLEYQDLLAKELEDVVAKASWTDVLAYKPKPAEIPGYVKPEPLDALPPSPPPGDGGSLSAAVAGWTPKMSELIGHTYIAPIVAKLRHSKLMAPALELGASPFHASRMAVMGIVDTGLVTKGHAMGFSPGTPMEGIFKSYNAGLQLAYKATERLYGEYKTAGGKLSRSEFYEEAGKAMRRSDHHDVPQIKDAAKAWRTVEQTMTKEAQRLGLLDEALDPKTAPSYLTRVYNIEKLRDPTQRAKFRDILANWLRLNDPDQKVVGGMPEYQDIANSIIDTIMATPAGRIHAMNRTLLDPPKVRGPLHERVLLIPDEYIEEFLESNVLTVMSYYVRTMAGDLAYYKTFKDGNKGLQDAVMKIREEADRLIAAAESPREKKYLDARANREMEMVKSLANLARGVRDTPENPAYRGLVRLGKTARTLNYTRLLGNVLISSVVDAGKIVMEEGLARTLGTVVADMMTGFKGIRLSLREAQAAGVAWDMHGMGRTQAVMDLGERYASTSKFERGLDAAGQFFSQVSLLAPWTAAMKGVSSALISTRILKASLALAEGGRISQRDITKLAQAGIDRDMAKRIAAERAFFDEHNGGILIANFEKWKDPIAADAMRQALIRDVDNTVITPGVGDAPLWTSTEWGKTIFQFKRFASASTQRILVSGLQMHDMQAMNGVLALFGLGLMGAFIRDQLNPKAPERTTAGWIKEGIDKSGVISMFMEMDSLFDKATGGLGVARALSGEEAGRFVSQGALERGLGPTAGLFQDIQRAISGLNNGDLTQADMHRMRRLMPGQNLFYARWGFDMMERGIADHFGLPEKQATGGRRLP